MTRADCERANDTPYADEAPAAECGRRVRNDKEGRTDGVTSRGEGSRPAVDDTVSVFRRTVRVTQRVLAACTVVTSLTLLGCARRPPARPSHRLDGPVVTPADAPPVLRERRGYAEGELPAGWARYEQRKTIRPGQTVTAGPVPYATVKLIEVAEDNRSAVFDAVRLVDRRRGRVSVGQHFNVFTPIFGNNGARLESANADGATVVFRWAQNTATAVPPGAVRQATAMTRPTDAGSGDRRSRSQPSP